jgi:ribonuclease-3
VLASVIEAVIGACYLQAGYERTAQAVVQAFAPEVEEALEHPVDFKSALQEMLAQRGDTVVYAVTSEEGPPHERTFAVAAKVDGHVLGCGSGRSKKHAEQEAAREAVERLGEA